jgi:hypothetical protein
MGTVKGTEWSGRCTGENGTNDGKLIALSSRVLSFYSLFAFLGVSCMNLERFGGFIPRLAFWLESLVRGDEMFT